MDELRKSLFYESKNGYDLISVEERIAAEEYCAGYIDFMNQARTEREAVKCSVSLARERGFKEYRPGMELEPGMKIYSSNRGKALFMAVIGKSSLSEGMVIAGAHVDSPRLDMKQLPLNETEELCYFRTHYYGGIKKYQWLAIPLELHGTVALKSGETVDISIGREPGEPRFVISDIMPHLAADQMKKTMAEGVTGEGLRLLIGSVPYACEGKDRVKLAVLSMLNDEYGITEEDFLSAELCAVPAYDACEIGFDRSLIGGYAQDDRVCAYAQLKAILDTEEPERTCVCVFADKEEIGSEGATSMQSGAFDAFIEDLCAWQGVEPRRCYENSICMSLDVCPAYDPLYPELFENSNTAKLNHGLGVLKYTGSRGKSATNDASAELFALLRRCFDKHSVVWQSAELGKVDQGGGGTIAKFMARRNIDTIDAGTPLLSMHAPFELTAKLDCYMTYRGTLALFKG